MCGIFIGFPNALFVATARTGCVCFTVELDALERLVKEHIQFVGFLRSERKFNGIDQLIEQLKADVDDARELLAGASRSPGA